MDSSLSDTSLVSRSVLSSLAIYVVLSLVSANGSKLPLLASVFVFTNMISRTATFQGLAIRTVQWSERRSRRNISIFGSKNTVETDEKTRFSDLAQVSRTELLEALVSLRDYSKNSSKTNERRRKLYKMMSWRQQKLCDDAGYSDKLKKIDTHVDKNQELFDAIRATTENVYGIDYRHYNASDLGNKHASQNTSTSNYRVVESLGHFVRDWTPEGEKEIAPMLHYITSQLDQVISAENAEKTCIVVPGSGLGRIAHEIANHRNYGAVHAVEFSGLMHTCNQYVYSSMSGSRKLYPYVHTTSNFITTDAQFRQTSLPQNLQTPQNLHLHLDDFRYFFIPEKDKYDTVVVVSAFFIDTAENILDYFDQINQLSIPSKKSSIKNGYWINFGPLKYGSASQAELNATEIKHIRKGLGWVDIHSLNTIEDPENEYSKSEVAGSGLSGYITDPESLWQGYYGISMWTSGHKSNQGK